MTNSVREPAQVAALPHTAGDIPVTWAAAWSSELGEARILPDPLLVPVMGIAAPALFTTGVQGVGEPRIGLPHPERVRRCVITGLCQVCGQPLPEGPRTVIDLRLGQQEFRYGKRLVPLLIDAWTCAACLPYSLAACPFLCRAGKATVMWVKRWLLVPTPERPKWVPDSVPYGPVGFVKIAALEYESEVVMTGPGQQEISQCPLRAFQAT